MSEICASRPATLRLVEGIVRVVSTGDGRIVLEPEQTTSCGHCASSAACHPGGLDESAGGMGSVEARLASRRFTLAPSVDLPPLAVGERLVVAVRERALLKAALVAYGLPLLAAISGGAVVQGAYASDALTMLGMLGGLALGFAFARVVAGRLASQGDLNPHYLRHAKAGETCGLGQEGA